MSIPRQTAALLRAARTLVECDLANSILLITEKKLDWADVRREQGKCRLFIAAETRELQEQLANLDHLELIELELESIPSADRITAAILSGVKTGQLTSESKVVVLYNGIADLEDLPEHVDSLSLIHLREHLEKLNSGDLKRLATNIEMSVLKPVIDLASEIGREGREGKPVGALIILGDSRRVMSMCRAINFNPFKGYGPEERDVKDSQVREQIKDIAQMDGAIVIGADGIAIAACVHVDVPGEGVRLAKGFGSRHRTAAAISRKTNALAIVVSQSSGTVRVFQAGEMILHIEPLQRPHIWQPFRVESSEAGLDE